MIRGVLFACGGVSILTTVGIVVVLVAESVGFFREVSAWEFLTGTEWTSSIASGMLRDALDAFVQLDCDKARQVLQRDDRVDQLHESLLRSMITVMMESPQQISTGLTLILASRNVERVADLATNIGEDVVYLVEGKTIRHPDVVHS